MLPLASLMLALYTQTNPISITACSTEPLVQTVNAGDAMLLQQIGSQLQISFTNAGPKTVRSVTFAVKHGSSTTNIVDAGTFSIDAKISHDFDWSYVPDAVDCSVVAIQYADGTTW